MHGGELDNDSVDNKYYQQARKRPSNQSITLRHYSAGAKTAWTRHEESKAVEGQPQFTTQPSTASLYSAL